jgi:hypothetical protein
MGTRLQWRMAACAVVDGDEGELFAAFKLGLSLFPLSIFYFISYMLCLAINSLLIWGLFLGFTGDAELGEKGATPCHGCKFEVGNSKCFKLFVEGKS